MEDVKRLFELALKGLEAERKRVDEEIRAIQAQLRLTTKKQSARPTKARISAEGREAISKAMKLRWVNYRRARRKSFTK